MLGNVAQVCRRARVLSTLGIVLSVLALLLVPVSVTPTGVSLEAAVCQMGGCVEDDEGVCAWGEGHLDEGYKCSGGACMSCLSYDGFCFNGENKIDGYVPPPM